MSKFIIYEVQTGKIVRLISGLPILEQELPQGCWFLSGEADLRLNSINVDSENPNEHFVDSVILDTVQYVSEKQIKYQRDLLELETLSAGGYSFDVDEKSLLRIERAISQWDNLSMTVVNNKINWTLADNSVVELTKDELIAAKDLIDMEIAKRSDRLFYHARTLISQLPNVTEADIATGNWPLVVP